MMTFARHRRLDELKQLCAERGITLNTDRHDNLRIASDFVTLSGQFADRKLTVIYSVFNGNFHGRTEDGLTFTHGSLHDDEPWFAALLNLVFVPQEAVHA